MRRSKEDAEQTRIAILNAAEDLFSRKGVDATSLEQIARAVSVTRGAVYWHFKDKAALIEALRARYEPPQHAIIRAALADNHPDIFKVLAETGPAFLRHFADHPSSQKMFSILSASQPENGSAIAREDFGIVLKLTTLARETGILDDSLTPEEAALFLSSFMQGLLSKWILLDRSFDLPEVGSKLMARQLASLRKPIP